MENNTRVLRNAKRLLLVPMLAILLSACSTGPECGPFDFHTARFHDTLTALLPIDSAFVTISQENYNSDTTYYKIVEAVSSTDSIRVRLSIDGLGMRGTTIHNINTSLWRGDTLAFSLWYYTSQNRPVSNAATVARSTAADSVLCSPIPESYLLDTAVIEVPKSKHIRFVEPWRWKMIN